MKHLLLFLSLAAAAAAQPFDLQSDGTFHLKIAPSGPAITLTPYDSELGVEWIDVK